MKAAEGMTVVCDTCGRAYRNEAPLLVGKVEGGKLSMQPSDGENHAYWLPACKCKPMTPRVEAA